MGAVAAALLAAGGLLACLSVEPVLARAARFTVPLAVGLPGVPPAPGSPRLGPAAVVGSAAPVLIVPGELAEPFGRKILIAWNQSNEAMAAVRRALPLLQAADAVEITVVDPSPSGPERSDPGGALCQMLTRHGVKAEIAVLARTMPQISDILNRRATEIGADMVVMGAYGHSRFRQAILGGATRNMLEKAKVPVLMAR